MDTDKKFHRKGGNLFHVLKEAQQHGMLHGHEIFLILLKVPLNVQEPGLLTQCAKMSNE